ncbi:uncharacterized protein LOC121425632 isoform X1 [Lytechinus variegatus]|uniref:uncharacterized protein LOC121425024 isoform X1 n=1 Tax=Lytechinus variegatus TaxID=7654 RepID=UPI001BB21D3D|nr:uncharacterized protein LOC121425024 isoform X1 [Lytechinus variegatus]XP_041477688.1 uncharacterized protein LOC121425632 isoform X1 [Lytechinus variegatus]
MADRNEHMASSLRIVLLCLFFFNFMPNGLGFGDVEWYENYTVNGWTIPVCTRSLPCNSENCSTTPYNSAGQCYCDPVCFYFSDCCIDFFNECEEDLADDDFSEATKGIYPSQFSCVKPAGNPQFDDQYLMVSKCDERWNDEKTDMTKAKCESQAMDEDSLTFIPVVYMNSITFKNIYCVLCNFKNDISRVTPWGIDATCLSAEFANTSRSNFNNDQISGIIKNCYWNFVNPFSSTAARRCDNARSTSCDVDQNNDTMVQLAEACESYKGVVSVYNNPHCHLCYNALVLNQNLDTIYLNMIYMKCPPSTTDKSIVEPIYPYPNYPISVLFDFSSVNNLPSHEQQLDLSCGDNQIYDQYQNVCLNLSCPVGYSLMNSSCQRLPSNLSCLFEEGVPVFIEMECMYAIENNSNCNPDVHLPNTIISLFDKNYMTSSNLSVSNFQAEAIRNRSLTVCSQRLEIWGYLQMNVDVSQENLDSVILSKNIQNHLGNATCSDMTLTISIGCSNLKETCPNVALHDDFVKSHDDGTRQKFLIGEIAYYFKDSLYSIEYNITSAQTNSKREYLQVCKVPSETCTLVSQNVSLFVDLGNGSYLYLPLNRTLTSNDYIEVGNDTIFVCSYVLNNNNSSGFLNFSSAQSILSTIGLTLSVIALFLTFLSYLKFNLLRKATSNILIMSLCVTLIVAQLFILFGGLAALNSSICISFAIMGHYMWIAVFSHTTALAFDLQRRFGIAAKFGHTDEGASVLSRFLLFVWACPVLVLGPCLGVYFTGKTFQHFSLTYNTLTCWIGDGLANLYVFGIPVACFLIINIILFVMVVVGLHQMRMSPVNKHKSKDSKLSSDLLIYIKMSTLLGFTWVFGFIAAFAGVTALWYIFIILNSLQGVYIFIAFVCNQRVLILWKESCPCFGRLSSMTSSKSRSTSSEMVTMKKSKGKVSGSESML